METPFDSILLARSERAIFLKRLFGESIAAGLFVAVIVKRGWRRIPLSAITATHKYLLTSAVDADTSAQIAETVANCVRWHMNGFSILIGEKEVVSALVKKPELLDQAVPAIMSEIEHKINGYIFPLDDELLFFGDDLMEQVVGRVNKPR